MEIQVHNEHSHTIKTLVHTTIKHCRFHEYFQYFFFLDDQICAAVKENICHFFFCKRYDQFCVTSIHSRIP